jgi:hypothetical protein
MTEGTRRKQTQVMAFGLAFGRGIGCRNLSGSFEERN